MNEIKAKVMLLFSIFFLTTPQAFSSNSDSSLTVFSIESNIDAFYSYDFNQPKTNGRLPFLVNHNRHNEFNINIVTIGTKLENDSYRANIELQAGSYAQDNYSNEDEIMRLFHEAIIGVALDKKKKLWIDAGIMNSHIGFESTFQIRDLTLTRSLMAESVPYFLTGVKLGYTFNTKWYLMLMVANGWQRIKRVEGNSLLSFCSQLSYNPTEKLQLNWSMFVGTDDPDESRRMRYFSDVFAIITISNKWDMQVGVDYGIQQKSKGSSSYDQWMMASLIARYRFIPRWFVNARIEYASDKANVVIANPSSNQFETLGYSLGLDYFPIKGVIARIEGKYLEGLNEIYPKENGFVGANFSITAALSIQFTKKWALRSSENELKK